MVFLMGPSRAFVKTFCQSFRLVITPQNVPAIAHVRLAVLIILLLAMMKVLCALTENVLGLKRL